MYSVKHYITGHLVMTLNETKNFKITITSRNLNKKGQLIFIKKKKKEKKGVS